MFFWKVYESWQVKSCSLTTTLWAFGHEVLPLSLIDWCWFLFSGQGWCGWLRKVGFNSVILSLSIPGRWVVIQLHILSRDQELYSLLEPLEKNKVNPIHNPQQVSWEMFSLFPNSLTLHSLWSPSLAKMPSKVCLSTSRLWNFFFFISSLLSINSFYSLGGGGVGKDWSKDKVKPGRKLRGSGFSLVGWGREISWMSPC